MYIIIIMILTFGAFGFLEAFFNKLERDNGLADKPEDFLTEYER